MAHYVGDTVPIYATFQRDGLDIDPPSSTIVFIVVNPNEVQTNYTYGISSNVIRDGVGKYHCNIAADTEGYWTVNVICYGTTDLAGKFEFTVDAVPVGGIGHGHYGVVARPNTLIVSDLDTG